jgi:formate dehydrogenase iron-sulfur subunit
MPQGELLLLDRSDLVQISLAPVARLVPDRLPAPGEQYRFHFDMAKCIGCKCCVVACNEQNGNPAEINWRQVGELEGGVFPHAQRLHLSMACNHCAEPTCLSGCPVVAYSKDPLTGIVDHSADTCIGCQYCVWNCSYGVPQFNPERGVVGKCDMCHARLSTGFAPACVDACPKGAIAIEIVNLAEWRQDHASANAPGLPDADDSLSTTRVTLPAKALPALARVDEGRREPQHVHYSLVFLLVVMQMAAGAAVFGAWPWAVLGLTMLGLAAAPLHLGRPAFAYRAWRGWKTSWLSREVLAFGAFFGAVAAWAWWPATNTWILAALTGVIGTYCSARIYMIPARPAWNTPWTLVRFFLTAAVLGALVAQRPWIAAAALAASLALDGDRSRIVTVLRALALVSAAVSPWAALPFALVAEWRSRADFFAHAEAKSVAGTFLKPKGGHV